MSTSEFLPPDEMSLEAAGEVLARELGAHDGRLLESDLSFYDTFDGLLHAAGLWLVHTGGELELGERESGRVRARLKAERPERPLFAGELADGPLRDALLEITEVRALLPLVDVHSRERPLDVLDADGKIVVRLALSEPSLSAGGLRARLRVSGVRGYHGALARVRDTLRKLGFREADQPLIDEAVRACGGVPGGVSSRIEVALRPEQRADAAAAAVLRRLLEVIEANLDGTLADIDSEFLHDFRVAVRRTRSVQRELRPIFSPEALEHFRAEFRWLQQVTGDARDLDVYVLEFEDFRALVPESMRADLEPLLAVLRARRRAARRKMERALVSKRAVSLLAGWSEHLDELERGGAVDRPIGELAAERILAVYERMRRMGEAIDDTSPPVAYHDLRKKGKELRYLLELFGAPLYPAEVVRPMVRALKALQDVLGRHQDREIQMTTLQTMAGEVAQRSGGPPALMAMGALVQRLGEDELAARAAFAERFAVFASKRQRTLVRETFG